MTGGSGGRGRYRAREEKKETMHMHLLTYLLPTKRSTERIRQDCRLAGQQIE